MTNNIDSAFAPLAQWLRCNGRQALNTETGGGNTQSCITYLGQQLAYVSANSDGKKLSFLYYYYQSPVSFHVALTRRSSLSSLPWICRLVRWLLCLNLHSHRDSHKERLDVDRYFSGFECTETLRSMSINFHELLIAVNLSKCCILSTSLIRACFGAFY